MIEMLVEGLNEKRDEIRCEAFTVAVSVHQDHPYPIRQWISIDIVFK